MLGRCCVVGGSGALGRAAVKSLAKAGGKVVAVDFVENTRANRSIVLGLGNDLQAQLSSIQSHLGKGDLDVVFCAAGGFAMEPPLQESNSAVGFIETWESLRRQNAESAILTAATAMHSLKPSGLLIFTGAAAGLAPSPAMIPYGMTKACTHHLVKSLAAQEAWTSVAILPETLDTESNRKAMGEEARPSWTDPALIADKVVEWASDRKARPASGALIRVITRQGHTTWRPV